MDNDKLNFFDNYRFFINPYTNEIEIRFICEDCKKVITKNELGNYTVPASSGHIPLYHQSKFWCKDCYNKTKQITQKSYDKNEHDDSLDKIYSSLYKNLGVSSSILDKSPNITNMINKHHNDDIDAKIYAHNYLETNLKNLNNKIKKEGI